MTAVDDREPRSELLAPISDLCIGPVRLRTEGARHFVHMEGLQFTVRGNPMVQDALLCLNHDNPTYPTKLYLAQSVGADLNWNETASFFGRAWYTWSWKDVSPNQSPIEILAGHLAAFERKAA